MGSRRRDGLIGGTVTTVVIPLLFLVIIAASYYVFIAPDMLTGALNENIPENFEPFSERTVRTEVDIHTTNTKASGTLNQALYSITIRYDGEEFPLLKAVRRHAYCRDKEMDIQLCETVPPKNRIETRFREDMDAILGVGPDTDTRPYRVEITYNGDVLFAAGDEGGGSSFVFHKPIPGGEHVRYTFAIPSGGLSTGVLPE